MPSAGWFAVFSPMPLLKATLPRKTSAPAGTEAATARTAVRTIVAGTRITDLPILIIAHPDHRISQRDCQALMYAKRLCVGRRPGSCLPCNRILPRPVAGSLAPALGVRPAWVSRSSRGITGGSRAERPPDFALLLHPEQPQVDRLRHRLVAGVVRVEVVALVELGADVFRVGRVAVERVEVDHPVEGAAGADPLVDRGPLRLLGLAVVA